MNKRTLNVKIDWFIDFILFKKFSTFIYINLSQTNT